MITIDAKSLAEALSVQGKIVSKKSSVRLEAKDGTLKIHGTDLSTHLVLTIPCEGSGTTCVSRGELVKAIKDAKGKVEIDAQDARVRVITSAGVTSLDALPDEEFPALPEVKGDPEIASFDESFAGALEYILPAVSTDEFRGAINNVCLLKGRIVGTDGHRMHIVSGDTLPSFAEEVLLPRTVVSVLQALEADRGIVAYIAAEKIVVIKGEGYEITSRADDSKFPDIDQVIPKGEAPIVFGISPDVIACLRQAIDGKREVVTLDIDESMVVKAPYDAFTGNVPIERIKGGRIIFGINARYLIEAIDGQTVLMEFSDDVSPVIAKHQKRLAVIMPCRF